ncbi:complement C1q tumor necrosis factor-related protein 3-like [Trematomus bernacchii]|uniref:complement C1q tumor necrosis factor-related protein 3-like n=1 Tax=Trematomus bernacchii TaxID=40690 RepID=UPI00146EA170|nr:complement C1q tumor necrosis factor-related protein 3-like [Trematomus bernacchii]
MASSWLVLLALCAAVRAQTPTKDHGDDLLNPEITTEEELRVLVQQLVARVESLERGPSPVAFSASLVSGWEWTHQGPFPSSTTLLFRRVTTNLGNAYDPSTGVFTAPLKGLYYVRFTGSVGSSGSLNAALMKNDENMFAVFDTRGTHGSASNGMALELQAGDRLSVTLWEGQSVFDQSRISTFSGFLLQHLQEPPPPPPPPPRPPRPPPPPPPPCRQPCGETESQ